MKPFLSRTNWRAKPWPVNSFILPKLQAHRGYWVQGCPENSLSAFSAAKYQGFSMFECDVQLTKEGVPVLFHDRHIKQEANLNLEVSGLSLKEFKEIVGGPTLEEVLESKDRPEFINIELKTLKYFDAKIEKQVSDVVKKCKVEDATLFSSFNPISLWVMSQFLPQTPRALLATTKNEIGNNFILKNMLLAPIINIHILHLCADDLEMPDVRDYAKKEIPIAVWTVNELSKAKEFLSSGAQSIITDTITNIG